MDEPFYMVLYFFKSHVNSLTGINLVLLLILPWFKFQDSYMLDLFFNRYLLILCRTHVYKKNVSVIFKYIISYLIMSVKLNGKFSKNINAIVFYDISRSMFLHFFFSGWCQEIVMMVSFVFFIFSISPTFQQNCSFLFMSYNYFHFSLSSI